MRRRPKEVWSKAATRRTETGYEAALAGRACHFSRSPDPSRAKAVDPAEAAAKAIELTWETCVSSRSELRKPQGDLTGAQESAEGIVGRAVGKAGEALQAERRSNR